MTRAQRVGQRAWDLHDSGFHCAEAVGLALWEAFGQGDNPGLPRMATAFGGGIGRSHQEICGALSGGFLALGLLRGRDLAGEDWGRVAAMADQLRGWFASDHGTTNCGRLLEGFGPQEGMARCKGLTREVAQAVAALLAANADQER